MQSYTGHATYTDRAITCNTKLRVVSILHELVTINRGHAHHTYLSMINDRTISRSYTCVYDLEISRTRLIDAIIVSMIIR